MLIERIEIERERAGLRPEFLAHMIGVTGATYYKWRKGTRIPADKLAELSKVLDCSADYLLGLTDKRKIAG